MTYNIDFSLINPKQVQFMRAKAKHTGYGGARGGGKSWSIRTKAKVLALAYGGIKMLIVRRTYPELFSNHINALKSETVNIAKYNDTNKMLTFINGSTIKFMYCANDADLEKFQGMEYDVIFLDEAGQLSEFQMKSIFACLRGVNNFPKRMYYTMNPGGQGHGYLKRIFIDREYQDGENPDDYFFIQALPSDNIALMKSQPDYIKQLEALPPKLRKAWLYGDWNIFEGMFFEEFTDDPEHYDDRQWTHVINEFNPRGMNIYRSYDFGYNKPFSCAWWAVDNDGVIYRILELYGCGKEPNEGVKWTPLEQFKRIAEIEAQHPYLKGKRITGVADPSIWDTSRGESIADTASKCGVYFTPGDNKRIAGWMQCHYRLQFDENGYPMMYVFKNCKAFIRTIPLLLYDETDPEDLDTSLEDHVADEWRYFCMSRPIKPRIINDKTPDVHDDPLNMLADMNARRKNRYNI
ncbi:MAG: phage terminase large subunit [Ruminococcus sp.]|nr:phage terminase large subunit [Ruminococcus sp.]